MSSGSVASNICPNPWQILDTRQTRCFAGHFSHYAWLNTKPAASRKVGYSTRNPLVLTCCPTESKRFDICALLKRRHFPLNFNFDTLNRMLINHGIWCFFPWIFRETMRNPWTLRTEDVNAGIKGRPSAPAFRLELLQGHLLPRMRPGWIGQAFNLSAIKTSILPQGKGTKRNANPIGKPNNWQLMLVCSVLKARFDSYSIMFT